MTRKPGLLLTLLLTICFYCNAQTIAQINLKVSTTNASLRSIIINTDNAVLFVEPNGNIRMRTNQNGYDNWINFYADGRGQKTIFPGDVPVTYHDIFDGPDQVGRVKSIDNITISYYDRYDGFDNIGKLKTLGDARITYYDRFDGPDNGGKLKTIGDTRITYYDRFDGPDNIGKLKAVGNTKIAYCDRFDGDQNLGRVKSVTGDTPGLNIIRWQ